MHTIIKQAYETISLDAFTKQKIIKNLEVIAMQNEFIEEDQLKAAPTYEKRKITVPLLLKKQRRVPKLLASVVSFAVVVVVAVAGAFFLSGQGNNTTPISNNNKVNISTRPTATQPAETNVAEDNKIIISQAEFEAGIAKIKTAVEGVSSPSIEYASNNLVIINDYWGMLFYDYKERKPLGVLDTKKYEINHIQGSDYTMIDVSVDGRYVSFSNVESKENIYVFDLTKLTLEKGKTLENTQLYDGSKEVHEKMSSYVKEKIDGYYSLSDVYASVEDGRDIVCALKVDEKEDSDKPITMKGLCIIELRRGKSQGATTNLFDYFEHDIIKIF